MDFMQEQYLTSARSERVRYCFCHENIKSISLSCRVMFFLLYGRFEFLLYGRFYYMDELTK